MEAIREIKELKGNQLVLELPESFASSRVEILVLRIDDEHETENAIPGKKRQPSPALKGTRIVGDILSPVIPDTDWDVLK